MLMNRNLVPQIIFVFFVLPKSSKQEKPEDCIVGKQYWSTDLNPKGTCAPCPHHWRNCDDQPIGDDYRCRISCRVKPTIPLSTPPFIHSSTPMRIPTSSYTPPEHSDVLPSTFTPGPVIYRSTLLPDEPRKHKKSIPFDINQHVWLIILLAVLSVLVILSLVVLVVVLVRKSEKRGEIYRNVEDGIALQPLQQNNGGDHVHQANDGEVRAPLPNDEHFQVQNNAEVRLRQPNDGEVRAHLPDDEHFEEQNNADEPVRQPHDGEDHSQSLRPPVQATPSDPWTGGIQEENTRLSSLDVHCETHT